MARPKHTEATAIEVIEIGLPCLRQPGRPVEVGERFKSIVWAECFTGIGKTQIAAQLAGRAPAARGVRFAYVEDL